MLKLAMHLGQRLAQQPEAVETMLIYKAMLAASQKHVHLAVVLGASEFACGPSKGGQRQTQR